MQHPDAGKHHRESAILVHLCCIISLNVKTEKFQPRTLQYPELITPGATLVSEVAVPAQLESDGEDLQAISDHRIPDYIAEDLLLSSNPKPKTTADSNRTAQKKTEDAVNSEHPKLLETTEEFPENNQDAFPHFVEVTEVKSPEQFVTPEGQNARQNKPEATAVSQSAPESEETPAATEAIEIAVTEAHFPIENMLPTEDIEKQTSASATSIIVTTERGYTTHSENSKAEGTQASHILEQQTTTIPDETFERCAFPQFGSISRDGVIQTITYVDHGEKKSGYYISIFRKLRNRLFKKFFNKLMP